MKFLASAILLWLLLARYATSQMQTTGVASAEIAAQCSTLAKRGQAWLPLVKTCEFAFSFRHSLPNFICEQNMENSGWPRTAPPVVIHAKVRYENGRDSYSDLIVDGERAEQQNMEAIEGMSMATSGEFGSQLMNLFRAPMVAEFKPHQRTGAAATGTVVYHFSVSAKNNKFWVIKDRAKVLHPRYEGELYVDGESGRPLRMVGRWTHLPRSFQLKSAVVDIQYRDTAITDLGTFLLPAYSEAKACARSHHERALSSDSDNCVRNVMWFSECRKFASKSRIVLPLQH